MAVALAAGTAPVAAAAPVRIDDTGTYLSPPHLRMQWREVLARGAARQMEAQARLVVRLDARAYAGRSGRIYLVMAQDVAGSIVLQWQGRGLLMAGRIAPGERTLVYQGRIPGPVIEDQWSLLVTADGEWLSDTRRLDCSFELELD